MCLLKSWLFVQQTSEKYIEKMDFGQFTHRHCGDDRVNIRKLTPNECRKLQGFPSDWKQVVSDCQAYKQFGNAVTVNVSYALAVSLFDYITLNKKMNW